MTISALQLFTIGIGPSSSHTVGPMRAGWMFVSALTKRGVLSRTARLRIELHGSLGATGKGHGTDMGVLLGLCGETPETCDPDLIEPRLHDIRSKQRLPLAGKHEIRFVEAEELLFLPDETMPEHPNGLRIVAFDQSGSVLHDTRYLSTGGGFVVEAGVSQNDESIAPPPYPFSTGDELIAQCHAHGLSIAEIMLANEAIFRPEAETRRALLRIWDAMQQCVRRGISSRNEILPGPLKVKRRAPSLFVELSARRRGGHQDDLDGMDWLNLYAMAVSEENASGGRVVTAPTNGAAGIIPAVLHNYMRTSFDTSDMASINYLLTASAIGIIYKLNASISGAEVGCQGEVGVACSMAAAALCAVQGGTPDQVESAAEIGMEHNLGLTCDPVDGLVQIPCIERNAIGAAKAVNAARMALRGDGTHYVSLDTVIRTMRETGKDMHKKYKETSEGGLAIHIVQC